jgi:hypothetical protein
MQSEFIFSTRLAAQEVLTNSPKYSWSRARVQRPQNILIGFWLKKDDEPGLQLAIQKQNLDAGLTLQQGGKRITTI